MSEQSGSGNRGEQQPTPPTQTTQAIQPAPPAQPAPAGRRLPAWMTRGRTLVAAGVVLLALLVGGTGFAIGRATGDDHGRPGISDGRDWRQRGPGPGDGGGFGGHDRFGGGQQQPRGPQGGQAPGQDTAWVPSTRSSEGSSTREQDA